MAKVHFYYSTMNAGKSTSLLQSNHNYIDRGLKTILFTPKVDADMHEGKIHSRIGLEKSANIFDADFNFQDFFKSTKKNDLSCVLIDEAQFLTSKQVRELCKVCDDLNLPVMCYGIRTDFRGDLFPGSSELLALADNLIELKTICEYKNCARKATMICRLDAEGNVITKGNQIDIGGDQYKVFCRKHYRKLTELI
ncbi:MAG: thymidine kinase [Pseudomonadota bacterium]|jgi:thymidine kinase|nr:thymidine kinase [Pseudomonadota bacterium]|tara:strand:+ start:797 stop:1381 length:585 start_codon:yes stop_codon:yes gene_type:complete